MPTVDLSDGVNVAISSTSDDVAGYYVYNGQVPEAGTAGLIKALTAAEAPAYALCGELSTLAFGTSVYQLNVFAVDGI